MKTKHLLAFFGFTNVSLVAVIAFLLYQNTTLLKTSRDTFSQSLAQNTLLAERSNFETEIHGPSLGHQSIPIQVHQPEHPPAPVPAAVAPIDPSIFNPNDQQVAEWESLQEDFVNKVGNKLPTNAEEWQRWEEARQESDRIFRSKFGEEIYQKQLQAAAQENQVAFQ